MFPGAHTKTNHLPWAAPPGKMARLQKIKTFPLGDATCGRCLVSRGLGEICCFRSFVLRDLLWVVQRRVDFLFPEAYIKTRHLPWLVPGEASCFQRYLLKQGISSMGCRHLSCFQRLGEVSCFLGLILKQDISLGWCHAGETSSFQRPMPQHKHLPWVGHLGETFPGVFAKASHLPWVAPPR